VDLRTTRIAEVRKAVACLEVRSFHALQRIGQVLRQLQLQCVVDRTSDRLQLEVLVLIGIETTKRARPTQAPRRLTCVRIKYWKSATYAGYVIRNGKSEPSIVAY